MWINLKQQGVVKTFQIKIRHCPQALVFSAITHYDTDVFTLK